MAGEPTKALVGEKLTLAGWAARRRDHGGLIFVDLRDRSGITQLVINPELAPEAAELAHQIRNEFVLRAEGTLVARSAETVNPNMPTGEVELQVETLEIVSRSTPLPFQLDEENVDETLRLRHRWLDLRREKLQRNITLRAQMVGIIRREMEAAGFLDIQTPILFKPTPEGARDFVVPARLQPGRFYALPQSPQILKQLTMVAGFDRYYQIAICFRDEDLRADRVQEITQLDVEMSFPDQEFLFATMEQMYARIWRECLGIEIETPFPRMTFAEADRRFGTDKPDTRFELEIEDATEVTRELGVRRLRGRRGGALPARPAGVLPRRARQARGAREGVGGEGARVPRLRRGGRGALADREVPLRAGAGAVPQRPRLDRALRGGHVAGDVARARRAAQPPRPRARPDRRGRLHVPLGLRLPDVRARRGRGPLDGGAPPVHAADGRLEGRGSPTTPSTRSRTPTT